MSTNSTSLSGDVDTELMLYIGIPLLFVIILVIGGTMWFRKLETERKELLRLSRKDRIIRMHTVYKNDVRVIDTKRHSAPTLDVELTGSV